LGEKNQKQIKEEQMTSSGSTGGRIVRAIALFTVFLLGCILGVLIVAALRSGLSIHDLLVKNPTPVPSQVVAPVLEIKVENEGRYTPAVVPYGALVSTWSSVNTRDINLLLCLDKSGCKVTARGDWRSYVFMDGSAVPEDTLKAWISTQVVFFPFAEKILDNKGEEVWP